jgi:hypothetical protein
MEASAWAPGINNIVSKRTHAGPLLTLRGAPACALTRTELADPALDGYILDGVLSADECAALVNATEAVGVADGGFSFWGDASGAAHARFRSADTLEAEQPALAAALWARIAPLAGADVDIGGEVSARWERDLEGTWEPYGLNTQLLFARYGPGGHFAPHVDGQTELDFNTRSLFSVIIYLNDCAQGGATRMLRGEQAGATERLADGRLVAQPHAVAQVVPPRAGRALVFYQAALHDGEPVGAGCAKRIIRTDILYRRREPLCVGEADVRAYELYRRARDAEAAGHCTEAAALFRAAFKTSRAIAEMYGG